MQDTSLNAVLRPAPLGLIALADQITDDGWPEDKFWLRSPRHFIGAIKRELLLLEAGSGEADHLARIALFGLMALHVRAQGRSGR